MRDEERHFSVVAQANPREDLTDVLRQTLVAPPAAVKLAQANAKKLFQPTTFRQHPALETPGYRAQVFAGGCQCRTPKNIRLVSRTFQTVARMPLIPEINLLVLAQLGWLAQIRGIGRRDRHGLEQDASKSAPMTLHADASRASRPGLADFRIVFSGPIPGRGRGMNQAASTILPPRSHSPVHSKASLMAFVIAALSRRFSSRRL